MNQIFLLISIFAVLSCTTSPKKFGDLTQDEQRIKAVIMSLDNKISGSYGKDANGEFTKFNQEAYNTYLSKLRASRAQEMRDLIPQFEVKEFSSSDHGFQFCGYSSKLNIAFCDDTLCQAVEYFEKADSPKVIEQWKKELPLKSCPEVATKESQATPTEDEEAQQMSLMKVSPKNEILLDHKYFKVSYNQEHMLPNWVSYNLYASNLKKGIAKRRDKFFADPTLISMKAAYAKPTDFNGKIYDRGHLAPSEDFIWDQNANDETFVMSNMTPQKKKLNRGAWKSLETKVRNWACTEKELKVISGPILDKDLKKFKSNVSIPQKFFKIVIDETPPKKAIAFIFDQDDKKFIMDNEAVSMAEAENLSGTQFEKESGLTSTEYKELRNTFKANDWVESNCIRKIAGGNK